jgi:hypothetical protein
MPRDNGLQFFREITRGSIRITVETSGNEMRATIRAERIIAIIAAALIAGMFMLRT